MKSFQAATTAKIETTARMGREIGSTIRVSVVHVLAPAILVQVDKAPFIHFDTGL